MRTCSETKFVRKNVNAHSVEERYQFELAPRLSYNVPAEVIVITH